MITEGFVRKFDSTINTVITITKFKRHKVNDDLNTELIFGSMLLALQSQSIQTDDSSNRWKTVSKKLTLDSNYRGQDE